MGQAVIRNVRAIRAEQGLEKQLPVESNNNLIVSSFFSIPLRQKFPSIFLNPTQAKQNDEIHKALPNICNEFAMYFIGKYTPVMTVILS